MAVSKSIGAQALSLFEESAPEQISAPASRFSPSLANTDPAAWLANRATTLGGSDVAAALNISPWSSAYALACEKKGLVSRELTPAMRFGTDIEPVIRQKYIEATGFDVITDLTVEHPEFPFLVANPDAKIVGQRGVAEFKAIGWRTLHHWGTAGTDQIPDYYATQATFYMGHTQSDWCDFYLLDIEERDYVPYRLHFDQELYDVVINELVEFHARYLMTDALPDPDGSKATCEYLKQRFKKSAVLEKRASEDIEIYLSELVAVRAQKDEFETRESELENLVKEFMGDADSLVTSLWTKPLTWRSNKDGSKTDWQAVCEELRAIIKRRRGPGKKTFLRIEAEHTAVVQGARQFRVPKPEKAKTLKVAA